MVIRLSVLLLAWQRQQNQSDQERIHAMDRTLQQKEAELSRLSMQCCNLQADLSNK